MITVGQKPIKLDEIIADYPSGSVEQSVLKLMDESDRTFDFDSISDLSFELKLRREIVNAAKELARSGLGFRVFRESYANKKYWDRRRDGGFALKSGVKASEGIRDIFENGDLYATECATAMMMIYYKALLAVFPEDAFNKMFPTIVLMNWHEIPYALREVGYLNMRGFFPGDRRYFKNPSNPATPEWQGKTSFPWATGYTTATASVHIRKTPLSKLSTATAGGRHRSAYLMNAAGPGF
jgi:protein-glutamine gamma-glutamyltransferase